MTASAVHQPEQEQEQEQEHLQPEQAIGASAPHSRRGVLAAGVAGLVGAVAAALGRPAATRAAAGDPLIMGQSNFAGNSSTRMSTTSSGGAFWMTQNGSGSGVRGDSTNGHGGVFTTAKMERYGLLAQNNAVGAEGEVGTGAAVRAVGNFSAGVLATSTATAGVRGETTAENEPGVAGAGITIGVSGTAPGPTGSDGIGVRGTGTQHGVSGIAAGSGDGVSGEASTGNGVRGFSQTGYGVYGETSSSSYAGYFNGPARITKNLDFTDMISPSNPAGGARLFARTTMSNYELCVIFPSGTVHVISSEPVS